MFCFCVKKISTVTKTHVFNIEDCLLWPLPKGVEIYIIDTIVITKPVIRPQIVCNMKIIPYLVFELWQKNQIQMIFFAFRLYNPGKKSWNAFLWLTVSSHPHSPRAMLRDVNGFSSLLECPNIDWWGVGKDKSNLKVFS